jgi:hypothetical protein
MQSAHPEILKEYSKRPMAERTVGLWNWMVNKYNHVLRDEWALEAERFTNPSGLAEEHV